jgi:hypothetical protein
MQKIDPAFLFELGDQLRRVRSVTEHSELPHVWVTLNQAGRVVEQAVNGSIYTPLLRDPCRASALALIDRMKTTNERIIEMDWTADDKLETYDAVALQSLYQKFETLLLGDLQSGSLYLVSPKGGYDTDALIEAGLLLFAGELATKVPDAIPDVRAATRCIAFELPTAAGFHLHRAHESVLRIYWDNVTGGKKRPKDNNMGVYLRELDKLDRGKKAVRSHLRSIKDFHRNPLMHPEQSLENVDQALDLLAAIRCSIGYMLQEIKGPSAPLLEEMEAPTPIVTTTVNE